MYVLLAKRRGLSQRVAIMSASGRLVRAWVRGHKQAEFIIEGKETAGVAASPTEAPTVLVASAQGLVDE